MAIVSPWRRQAQRVIARVLEGLPAGYSMKEARAALRAAYPFGERSMHPYRIWCDEVRKALRPVKAGREAAPTVGLALLPFRPGEADGSPRLKVDCGWCEGRVPGGCMICLPWRQELAAVTSLGEWPGWRVALADGDPETALVLADRLGELGLDLTAAFFRGLNQEGDHA